MTTFRLSVRERLDLETLMACHPPAQEQCRVQALLWLAEGEPVDTVAQLLRVSRRAVYYWVRRFQDRADQSFRSRVADAPRAGRPRTAAGIIDPLLNAVIDQDPRELGYRSTGWTNALLRHYLQEVHHQEVSRKSVSLALARLGIRWKRPRHCLALRPDTWRQSKGGSSGASRGGNARSY
jgi:transposase